MINKTILIGNAGQDAESMATGVKFSIATNESYQDKSGEWQTQTEWHNCKCFGKQTERALHQIKKGKLIYVEGKISSNEHDGKRYTDIIVRNFRVLEKNETPQVQKQTSETDDLPF